MADLIYFKKFNTKSEYNTYIDGTPVLPNVSIVSNKDVYFTPSHDYSRDYLATIALEDGTISFNIWKNMGTDYITSISYSTDGGETWTTTQNQNNKTEHLVIDVNVNEGDKVLWKGIAQQTGYYDEDEEVDDYAGSFFSSTAEFDVEGNVMSLLYGDDFFGETELEYTGQFTQLFSDYDAEKECGVVNAENLILPATTLADYCYSNMFWDCTGLTSAPALPATTLASSCYYNMFRGCTSLTSAPAILPAETLAERCYSNMFDGCTSLTSVPELPATTLARGCYWSMFSDCTSLTSTPAILPAETLAERCYQSMFQGCTSLTSAPAILPATTLTNNCYDSMFQGCTSLTSAPVLPATTLANQCYIYMFSGCTSLTSAPTLPAITLAENCYQNMFYSCTNLNYIKCLATDISATNCTYNWVNGVASTGTFVKNPSMSSWTRGVNGIPTGWTEQDAS